jgi:hypothetical protein
MKNESAKGGILSIVERNHMEAVYLELLVTDMWEKLKARVKPRGDY